ncbi:MAG: ATP synthase subunit I [Clostridiales bacterium]|nr:ATP synthase subunit I [Clostridiales bacterium]
MKIQPAVKQETAWIAGGVMILTGIMVLVFVILGKFDYTVALGAVYGAAIAVLNFFLLGMTVQKAAEEMHGVQLPPEEEKEDAGSEGEAKNEAPENPHVREAKKKMQLSYYGRMLMTMVAAALALVLPIFHPIAALLPLLFPRIVIFIRGMIQGKKEA